MFWVVLYYNKHVLGLVIINNSSWVLLHQNQHVLGFTTAKSKRSGFLFDILHFGITVDLAGSALRVLINARSFLNGRPFKNGWIRIC